METCTFTPASELGLSDEGWEDNCRISVTAQAC